MRFKVATLLFLVTGIFFISGCTNEALIITEDKLHEEISYWSSNKFQGRLTGTEGNKKVQDEIEEYFEEIKLSPINNNDYSMPFDMAFYKPKAQKLEVNLNDGTTKEFTYGKDWIELMSNNGIDLELPISFSSGEGNILVTEEIDTNLENIRVQFIKTKTLHKTLSHPSPDGAAFQITEEFYNYLQTNEKNIKNIHLVYIEQSEQITAYNVGGKIEGSGNNNNKQAIVISAHYDHVGTAGETIFPGSADNAAGLTGLLKLAAIIKEDSKEKSYSSDILFVAFNGEESGLTGSQSFIKEISSQYDSIININLDTIGIKNGGDIVFSGETARSDSLSKQLQEIASDKQIESKILLEDAVNLTSDHVSFINNNYQAVNISQERFEKIHTTEDNPEYIDSSYLKSAIEIVHEFINQYADSTFENLETTIYTSQAEKLVKLLDFAEYRTFISDSNKKVEIVYNLNYTLSEDELKAISTLFDNNVVKTKNSQFVYILNNENTVTKILEDKDNIGEVKSFSDEEYSLGSIQISALKDEKIYNISIFEGELEGLEKNQTTVEKIGDWTLMPSGVNSEENNKTFAIATSTINFNNKIFTIIIQNTHQNIVEDPYTKLELESFIETFDIQSAVELLEKEIQTMNK